MVLRTDTTVLCCAMTNPKGGGAAFVDALQRGVLVGDGGMGTQLYERGNLFSLNYEEFNLSRPEVIRKVHEDFVRAGADVIETNSFGANAIRLARHGLEGKVRDINLAAVKIAREAAGNNAYVAGSIGPSGLIFEGVQGDLERVRAAFKEQAEALAEGGVDALVIETMRHPREIVLALDTVREVVGTSVPIIAQVSIDQDLAMADGTSILAMGETLKARGASSIGVNCSTGPQDVFAALEKLVPLGLPVTAMPNAGLPRRVDDRLIYVSTPEYFGVFARRMFKLGVRLIGGCCGTTPEHIRRIAGAARMAGSALHVDYDQETTVHTSYAPPAAAPDIRVVPMAEKSRLAAKIAAEEVRRFGRGEPSRGSRHHQIAQRRSRCSSRPGSTSSTSPTGHARKHACRTSRSPRFSRTSSVSRPSFTCAGGIAISSDRSHTFSARKRSASRTSSSSRATPPSWATSPTRPRSTISTRLAS